MKAQLLDHQWDGEVDQEVKDNNNNAPNWIKAPP
jgi:hypothetical protein